MSGVPGYWRVEYPFHLQVAHSVALVCPHDHFALPLAHRLGASFAQDVFKCGGNVNVGFIKCPILRRRIWRGRTTCTGSMERYTLSLGSSTVILQLWKFNLELKYNLQSKTVRSSNKSHGIFFRDGLFQQCLFLTPDRHTRTVQSVMWFMYKRVPTASSFLPHPIRLGCSQFSNVEHNTIQTSGQTKRQVYGASLKQSPPAWELFPSVFMGTYSIFCSWKTTTLQWTRPIYVNHAPSYLTPVS